MIFDDLENGNKNEFLNIFMEKYKKRIFSRLLLFFHKEKRFLIG
jgi:hypothetical protein